jgi:hypothetical protein
VRAKRAVGDVGRKRLQPCGIGGSSESVNEALPDLREAAGANATRDRLAARFVCTPAREHCRKFWNLHARVER